METLCCRRYSRAPRSCSRACSPRLYRWCIACVRECVRGVVSRHATAIPSIKKRIEEKRKLVFRGRIYRFDIRAKFIYLFFLLLSIIDLRRFFVRLHADAILFVGIRVVRIRGIEERVDFRSVFRLARLIAISKRTRLRKCTPHRFPRYFRSLFTRLPTRGDFLLYAASLDYPSQSYNGRPFGIYSLGPFSSEHCLAWNTCSLNT